MRVITSYKEMLHKKSIQEWFLYFYKAAWSQFANGNIYKWITRRAEILYKRLGLAQESRPDFRMDGRVDSIFIFTYPLLLTIYIFHMHQMFL